ncbi:MAG TPA: hypothetical protein VEA16_08830 [Vicinamibacterales bacterium]|nr:hypothetical protein [Vicinamibacterales bacterium]
MRAEIDRLLDNLRHAQILTGYGTVELKPGLYYGFLDDMKSVGLPEGISWSDDQPEGDEFRLDVISPYVGLIRYRVQPMPDISIYQTDVDGVAVEP